MFSVVFVLARLAGLIGALMLVPLIVSLFGASIEGEARGYLIPMVIGVCFFLAAEIISRRGPRPTLNAPAQGFLCVTLGWTLFAFLGAMPYWLSGVLPRLTDAFFESMSGFTTTGATVFTTVEWLPPGLLLWRAMTQFIGGLGIIALFVAVLPALGAGGVVLFRSEVSSSVLEDRLRPRIRDTAKVLWYIYAGLCAAQFLLLWIVGMSAFDALCHALTTVSTGGFSTSDLSFGAYGPAAEWITTVFMFLGGTSFLLHGKALRGELKTCYIKSEEFVFYAGVVVVSILIATVVLMSWERPGVPEGAHPLHPSGQSGAFFTALRHAAFQVLSVQTTTGFCSSDYDRWPDSVRLLLIILMFIGGCSGSTSGSIKGFRYVLFFHAFARQLVLLLHPSRVVPLRMGNSAVPEDALRAAAVLFFSFVVCTTLGAFVLALLGLPLTEAFSGTVACIMCVGPAFGDLGPTGNFAAVPDLGKWVLSLLMLAGRLEIYAVMVLIALVVQRR